MATVKIGGRPSVEVSGGPKIEDIHATSGYLHVASPTQLPGVPSNFETDNQSTTVTSKTFSPGLQDVKISYLQGSGATATGKELYVVFNALDATDAATKLAAAGSRYIVVLGETLERSFLATELCYRIDYVSKVAETGTSLVRGEGKTFV